jgi:hypothetical protein
LINGKDFKLAGKLNPADQAITDDELREMFSGDIPYRAGLRFYADESVDQRVIIRLRAAGVTITDVYIEAQDGEKADTRLLAKARELGAVMLTGDQGFEIISDRITDLKLSHAGIVLITRPLLQNPNELISRIIRLDTKFEGYPSWVRNQVFRI